MILHNSSYLFYQVDSLGGIAVSKFASMIGLSHLYLFYEADCLGGIAV